MKLAILGAGTMGLTLAHRLAGRGHEVVVFEAASQPGGLATWFDFGDFTWDKYYHVILGADSELLALIEELGLGDRMRWVETRSGFLWRGRHLSMSNNWEFLTFPALGLFEKLRLGLGILYCQRIRDPAPLEQISAPEWMTRVFGRSVYEAIWEPLMESKYGVLANELPATIMWSTITRYYSTRSRGEGKETMGYLSGGGLHGFFEALIDKITKQGGQVRLGRRVTKVDTTEPGVATVHCGDERDRFDRVISTLPTPVFEDMASEARGLRPAREGQPSALGVIRVALVLERPLSPYYVTNLIQKGFPFTGIIEVSSLVDPTELGGRTLVMLPRYDVPDSPWFDRDPDSIIDEFIAALEPVWPDIRDNLVASFVHREKTVQALWIEAPPPTVEARRTPDLRLWSVNAELAGRDTLNNNAVVRVADRAAEAFLASVGPES